MLCTLVEINCCLSIVILYGDRALLVHMNRDDMEDAAKYQ